jgi:uncharacterized protein YbbK (DUF523 family)
MSKIIVSACLLGENCKYNGGNNYDPRVLALCEGREVIPVCPEVLAGLGVPRIPIEIKDGIVIRRDGVVVDEAIRIAVAQILEQIKNEDIQCAVLKARSPTCGVRQVYDGTFSGQLVDGAGVLAQALKDAGYIVLDNEELEETK